MQVNRAWLLLQLYCGMIGNWGKCFFSKAYSFLSSSDLLICSCPCRETKVFVVFCKKGWEKKGTSRWHKSKDQPRGNKFSPSEVFTRLDDLFILIHSPMGLIWDGVCWLCQEARGVWGISALAVGSELLLTLSWSCFNIYPPGKAALICFVISFECHQLR